MTGELTQRPLTRSSPRQAAVRGKALELATQVLLVTLVPRLFGPAESARLTVTLAIVTLGAVAISLGSPSAFARFVPGEPESRRAGLARSMTIQLLPLRGAQLGIAGEWEHSGTGKARRMVSDAENIRLLERWLPLEPHGSVLKTDLFDEATGTGLVPWLSRALRAFPVSILRRRL